MNDLRVGMQLIHNQRPVELLFVVDKSEQYGQIWRVKPLFVEEPNRNELFEPNDLVSFLHTNRPDIRRNAA